MTFLIVFIIILVFSIVLIYLTQIKIQVSNFKFEISDKGKSINEEFKVIIKFNVFKWLNYFRFTINNDKLKEYNAKQSFDKIIKQIIQDKNSKIKQSKSNKKNLKIERLDLRIDVGIEDAALTAIATGIGATILSFLIGKNINKSEEIEWSINPIYNNDNLLKLDLNCIISIKLIHIIKRIYVMRKEDDRNARTSNRKNFKYIYE